MRLPLVATLVSTFVLLCNANFHISRVGYGSSSQYVACPSNYWNCKCWLIGDRAGRASNEASNNFSIDGMCGVGQMNLYKDANADSLSMYLNGGDGKVIGRCYRNGATQACGTRGPVVVVTDLWICYTYVCGS
jgi:hypothetical protein